MSLAISDVTTILSLADLERAGISPRLAARRVRRAEWQRPARGIYVTHAAQLSPIELATAAILYAGEEALLTGALPLTLLMRRWVPPVDNAHVLVPTSSRVLSSQRVQVSRWTHAEPARRWLDVPMASEARCVIDAARECRWLSDVRAVVLAAVADGHVTVEELQHSLAFSQRNGSAQVRRAVLDAERGCASPPEAELVDALVGKGVPFLVNPGLWHRGVLIGSPDVLLLGRATVGEVESDERHGSAALRTATYDRHERFATRGLDPVHLSVARVRRNPTEAANHLLARAARGAPMPESITVVPRGPVLR